MSHKDELLVQMKAISHKAGFRPKFYESLTPDSDGRIVLTVAAGVYLEDEHDDALDELNALTYNDPDYVIDPCGNLHYSGTLEECGLKQLF